MNYLNKIWKYLQRQLDPDVQKHVQEQKDMSAENLSVFKEVERIWSESDHLEDIRLFETEPEWESIQKELDQSKNTRIRTLRWVGIAASVILIALIIWLYPGKEEPLPQEPLYKEFTAVDTSRELLLPDSSIVLMEIGAKVKYFTRLAEDFEDRRVFLEGFATFDIAQNDSLPFVVVASKTGVKVLGTVFNVANRDSNDVSVENIQGLIKFYELGNEANAVTLEAGEKFNFNGEAFVDQKVPIEISVRKPSPKRYTIQELWYNLITKFDHQITIQYYGSSNPDATIEVDLNQAPGPLIRSLKANPKIDIEYKQTCPDCFDIERLYLLGK